MFDSLFGSEPSVAKFVIAFVIVIGLIALTMWLVRRFGASRLGTGNARGRQPRLAVIDAAAVDGRRRLVLIRRDNVEHLLMIGGPSDIVVEPNIVRAATRDTTRGAPYEVTMRPAQSEPSWPLQPSPELAPVAASRTPRQTFDEPAWTAPEAPPAPPRETFHDPVPLREQAMRARPDSLTGMAAGMAADMSARINPPETFGRTAPAVEPARREPEPERAADHNLAEMASRLEAALRRPPVTDPLAVAPDIRQPDSRTHDFVATPEPQIRKSAAPASAPDVRPPVVASAPTAPEPPAKDKSDNIYANLEQEMASLLGRPANK